MQPLRHRLPRILMGPHGLLVRILIRQGQLITAGIEIIQQIITGIRGHQHLRTFNPDPPQVKVEQENTFTRVDKISLLP